MSQRLDKESEILLKDILDAENPTQLVCEKLYSCSASTKDNERFRAILRKLESLGYIRIPMWADDEPYHVEINYPAYEYVNENNQFPKNEETVFEANATVQKIFISHRSTDKEIADALVDFLSAIGLPKDSIFCLSLPGNDVKNHISAEIKEAINCSVINIVILSREYYESAYCLNEAGIVWYNKTPVVVIARPEITPDSMLGFLNSEFKLRRLDNLDDIAAICEQCTTVFSIHPNASRLMRETQKLMAKYEQLLLTTPSDSMCYQRKAGDISLLMDECTDDELLVLCYIYELKVRKCALNAIEQWLCNTEIFDCNVTNAVDILQANGIGKLDETQKVFELTMSSFRWLLQPDDNMKAKMLEVKQRHTSSLVSGLNFLWNTDKLTDEDKLFIAYIIDERVVYFGDRWLADKQEEHIKVWENKNSLNQALSSSYGRCLSLFIENNFVFASSWTSYGNPREYTLHPVIVKYLNSESFPYKQDLEEIKRDNLGFQLPF